MEISDEIYAAISRKAVAKKCARDNSKGNMKSDQYTVPDTSCRTYFFYFLLALANVRL